MADEKVALRANDDPMAGAYRSPTSANAEARGIASGAAATPQADLDKSQSVVDTVPANDDKKPGPLAPASSKSPVASVWSSAPETARRVDALNAQSMKLNPPVYKPVPPPVVKNTDPMNVWGSLAMVVAGLGSLKTRQPMNTALNAAAGVIKGFHDGDKENADAQYKTWEAASKNAIETMRFETDAYKTALGEFKNSENLEFKKENLEFKKDAIENRDKVRIMAEMFKDPAMVAASQSDDPIKAMTELQDKRKKLADDLEGAGLTLEMQKQAHAEIDEMKADPEFQKLPKAAQSAELLKVIERANMANMTPAQLTRLNQQSSAVNDAEDEKVAQGVANYTINASNLSRRNGYNSRILAKAMQINPEFQQGDYANINKARAGWDVVGGKGAVQINALGTLAQHVELLGELMEKENNPSELPKVNAIVNWFRTNAGASEVTNIQTAKQFVANEVIKATTGVAGAEADRSKAEHAFGENASQEQQRDGLGVIKKLVGGRILQNKYEYERETKRKDFDQKVSPAGQQLIRMAEEEEAKKHRGAPSSGTTGAKPNAALPDAAVAHLKSDPTPDMQAKFDEVFGAGAAKRALGGQ